MRRAGGTPIRVASKSMRVRALLSATLARPGFQGVMAYSVAEALWLVSCGFRDVLMAYPSVDRPALTALMASPEALAQITLMVDDPVHLGLLSDLRGQARQGVDAGADAGVGADLPVREIGRAHV